MGMSNKTKKALRKAVKQKNKRRRGHWLFIQHGDSLKEIGSKLITQLAVLVLVGCGVILINELRLSLVTKQQNSSYRQIYEKYISQTIEAITDKVTGEKQLLPAAQQLMAINPDTVGFIQIDGMENIALPVVQRREKDGNDYYLKTAFDGSINKAGTVFLDRRAVLDADEQSDVLTLYGHNQKDGTMFGDLKYYKHDVEFYKAHPLIRFDSNYEMGTYKIFAYFVTETLPEQTADGNVFRYHNYIGLNKEKYDEYIDNIMLRSQIITSVDVQYGDKFLVLSTCSNEFDNSRFVVFARKTREGEDETVDTASAVINPNAKEPDWNVIY